MEGFPRLQNYDFFSNCREIRRSNDIISIYGKYIISFCNFLSGTFKYGSEIYDMFMNSFDCFPVAALVNAKFGKFLCMHGGLSPNIQTVCIANNFGGEYIRIFFFSKINQ